MGDVAITLPSGEAATVPQEDLAQAVSAGATPAAQPTAEEAQLGGGLGQAASFAFGAGRTASFGLMDGALVEGANIVGGESARKDMLRGLNVAKDANPYATMGGEAAGLLVGAGEGVTGIGSVVEEHASQALGSGLLGKIGSYGARGATEGALLGYGSHISEDTLGDVDFNGEKLFAAAGKDALLGGAIGGGLGLLGHVAGEGIKALRFERGPRASGLLDDIAGVNGAGTALREDARATEDLITNLQRTGATSEQAARMADEVSSVARARTAGGPLSGLIDDAGASYAAARAGANADMREVLEKGYVDRASRLANQENALDVSARKLAERGTRVMRDMEDVINDAQFTHKPENVAKLIDPAQWEAARDTATKALQDTDKVLSQLEMTASKGGQEGAVRNLRKQLTDFYTANSKIADGITKGAEGKATADFYLRLDAMKRSVDKFAGHGTNIFGRTEAAHEFHALADRLRSTLEDESTWGRMGAAQRETNSTFSLAKGRRDDFGRRFSVSVDQVSGVPVPELDAGKIKSALRNLEGAEGDQAVKSTEAFVDGLRARSDAIEKHFALSPEQASKLATGRAALDDFSKTFAASKQEASVISRLRTQQLEEQGRSLGGVIGLAADIVTKPLTTMERLGQLKSATDRLEKGVAAGIDRFFSGKSAQVRESVTRAITRPREAIVNEIGQLREIAANPRAMQQRVAEMLGDVNSFAPKTAQAAALTAMRALTLLANEAPKPRAETSFATTKPVLRFSDQQINEYENKRNAAFHPETIVAQMHSGRLNRDGIRMVEQVSPKLFAMMQERAQAEITKMAADGRLDKMPYQQQAALATLLRVTPDGTWKPDFIALMQSTKAPLPASTSSDAQPKGGGRRPIKMDTAVFATEAQQVEGRNPA